MPTAVVAAAGGAFEEIFDAARVGGGGGRHGDGSWVERGGRGGESHRVGRRRDGVRDGGGGGGRGGAGGGVLRRALVAGADAVGVWGAGLKVGLGVDRAVLPAAVGAVGGVFENSIPRRSRRSRWWRSW